MKIIVARYNALECPYRYRIAGIELLASEKIASLAAYQVSGDAKACLLSENTKLGLIDKGLQYHGYAQFNQKMREVHFWRSGNHTQLDIDNEPICTIDLQLRRITILNDISFDEALNLEVITGPALIFLLLQRGIYCLHAGCVTLSDSTSVAFLADSGMGKSTLSRQVDPNWQQRADDILPVSFVNSELYFHSFPQLKLANAMPSSGVIDQGVLLHGLFCLNAEPAEKIQINRLNKKDALLMIIRHTVAARLFDQQRSREHLIFAKQVVELLPVFSVSYPRQIEQLPELRSAIRANLL